MMQIQCLSYQSSFLYIHAIIDTITQRECACIVKILPYQVILYFFTAGSVT